MVASVQEPGSALLLAAEELSDHLAPAAPGPPGAISLWERIDRAGKWLHEVRRKCIDPPPEAGKAAEWLLDNDYQVNRALRQIEKDLPPRFYARLPAIAEAEGTSPRVFAIAHELLRASRLQLSLANAVTFIRAFQRRTPLTIAELWAFPTMLRIACIEILASAITPLLEEQVELPFALSSYSDDPQSLEATERVARAIANLANIAAIPWEDFFDRTSKVEEILRGDPARAYSRMDFETRDRYRRAVEEVARDGDAEETLVARRAVEWSHGCGSKQVGHHVGQWLIGEGRPELEREFAAVPPLGRRVTRLVLARAGTCYALAMMMAGLGTILLPIIYLLRVGAGSAGWVAMLAFTFLPASVLAITVVHWAITRILPPRVLPKLDSAKGLPADSRTVVIVPVVVAGKNEVLCLAEQLETHWLANSDPELRVALLADLADAPAERMAGDEAVEEALAGAIRNLNRRHSRNGEGPFHLLLRPRRYNPAQGCWMAWERKRGKLEEFNRMLVEGDDSAFSLHVGDRQALSGIRFVVTVDADTMLPPGTVAKLAGALAHPLNRPQIDEESGRVNRGYSIIQPRVEISPSSGVRSLFARLFTGDTAIDIYSRAVSDVYQDLFGSGIFVGKGIYDLHAFHQSVDGRVPENRILSHDLFEGAHGRAALATDIVLYENFPSSYPEYARRLHRWIRGDWQLLAWIWPYVPGPEGARLRSRIAGIDRWKMLDNLRRSLVPPSLVALALAGWFLLPGNPWFWTILVILAPAGQLFTDLVSGLARGRRAGAAYGLWARLSDQAGRSLLAVVYLLHETFLALHAIAATLWRNFVSHRNLLEWTAAAHVAARMRSAGPRVSAWREMWPGSALALATAVGLALGHPAALPPALLLIVPWILAPEITLWIGRTRKPKEAPLEEGDVAFLRRLARKTWFYFETFAGPEDNWLPPDNYQGLPHEEIAHRTSPTNIGMMLLSTAAAWDLGYLGRAELAARSRNVFDSLGRLERYRGHFYNWYETRHLHSLEPRYVSTVDSGNLAVALVAYAETLREAAAGTDLERQRWTGLVDLFDLVREASGDIEEASGMHVHLAEMRARSGDVDPDPSAQQVQLRWLGETALPALEIEAGHFADRAAASMPERVRDTFAWIDRLRHHVRDMIRDIGDRQDRYDELEGLAGEAMRLAQSMDFRWLYDRERRLFFIGHNVTSSRVDTHHYDLLASEARLASFFAIAKGDAPAEHWFHLQRPVMRAAGGLALVSWNGSMFEYLMPRLLLRSEPETLLGESERVAVEVQRRYGEEHRLPWGISESAYSARDPEFRFRYQAFGVGGLGLRRGLARDMVVAPYASALALAVAPAKATANLRRLAEMGASGLYGLWEAVDFTSDRVRDGTVFEPVNAFMAHHQGMILCAIANLLTGDLLVKRFARDPQVRLVSLLLSERIPHELPPEIKRLESLEEERDLGERAMPIEVWRPQVTDFPQVHLIGNGRLSSWVSEAGGGALRWHGNALTRFVPDATRDADGCWFYLYDEDSKHLWSATRQPTGAEADEYRVMFHSHMAEFHRRDAGIDLRLEIGVGAGDDIEIRRLAISNEGNAPRRLKLTSYAEIVLAPPLEDERHPAFSKLFVSGQFLPGLGGLLFTRTPRSPRETPPVLLQVVIDRDGPVGDLAYEVDRQAFIGRNRELHDPWGASAPLTNSSGATLDTIAALQVDLELAPGETRELAFLTIAAGSVAAATEIAERFTTLSSVALALDDAVVEATRAVHAARIPAESLPATQSLGSLLVYPHGALRAAPVRIRGNRLGQPSLWGLALSGDLPILLVRSNAAGESLIPLLAGAHQLWRRHGLDTDLVILQTIGSAYIEPMRDELVDVLRDIGAGEMLGRNGGIHLLFADQIGSDQTRLLEAMAWVILEEGGGALESQLAALPEAALDLPPILPSLGEQLESAPPLQRPADLLFDNGFGGFSPDGREYVIHLEPGETTPAPWANVLANDRFGTLVTETGGGFSWSINSGEHRLTAWTNDPVCDRASEILYLRDEETTAVWTVTPGPAGGDRASQVRHGTGYSEWRKSCRGIEQEMRVFVPRDAPVKLVRLRLRNSDERARRLTATYYAEWLLGSLPSIARRHVHCDFDATTQAILATSPWSADLAGRVAFLAASQVAHGFTTDRQEFLGREGSAAQPAALRRWGLGEKLVAGKDACGALQLHIDLMPGESTEILFVLGEGASRAEAVALAAKWRSVEVAREAEGELEAHWDKVLGAVAVRTPDPALDLMVNRWLPYQSLSSRILARSGFYQASGAIGFRDQLQDVLAFLHADPARARAHILECAAHQFEEGDVLHWWHPPSDRGVRTRFSDDLQWLPFATGTYVQATGDLSILDEKVPFLRAPPLAEHEEDRYARFEASANGAPLIEHCERALERLACGAHGLPLMGTGDWNDGMDRVGRGGKGESVWLAWFASVGADMLADLELRLGREVEGHHWETQAAALRQAAENAAWDGEWYRRAYDDEGHPLGSAGERECRIDSISQSWAAFAGADPKRVQIALEAAWRELVDEEAALARLLWPPFGMGPRDPGYIRAYPPGVRENGGQYCHAAAWLGLAFAQRQQAGRAHRIFEMISPVRRADSSENAQHYRIEPYVVAGDITASGSHRGQGGWSWYTGAAAWAWRLAVQGLLGINLREGRIEIAPSLPEGWETFEATLRRDGATIILRVENPGGAEGQRPVSLTVDGVVVEGNQVAFPAPGETLEAVARMGDAAGEPAEADEAGAV